MKLDSNAIEILAVGEIRRIIVLSPCLDEHINSKDKEPSVDGYVNLYKTGGKTKKNFYGRVTVQIKGSQKKISSQSKEVKFSVEISDLNFYFKDGGAIIFFVWISADGQRYRVFYNELLPVKIHKILSDSHRQSTKNLKFKEVSDTKSIERLFFAFYDEKKKQTVNLVDLPQLPSIDELQKLNVLNGLTFSVMNVEGYRSHVQAILNNDIYLYASIKGSPFPIPLDILDDKVQKAVVHEVHNSISAGNVIYEKSKMTETINSTIINIEDWFIATFSKTSKKQGMQVNLRFTLRKTLRERVKDSEFLIAFLDAGGFYLGESFCDLRTSANSISEKGFNIEVIKNQLIFMRKVLQLFEILHISEILDMTTLSERDLRELGILIRAFVDGEEVTGLRDDLPFNYYVKIGGILLALYHYEKDGNKYIGDIFSEKLAFGFDTDGKRHLVPACSMLDKEGWGRISNIDFLSVLPSFKRFYEQNRDFLLFNIANNTLLSIIAAFDQTQRPQLLELAIELSKWILEESPPEELGRDISSINYLQTVARKQCLEHNDVQQLMAIAENFHVEERIRVGAYLLLGNQAAAEVHFYNLDEETQRVFKSWPIYKFWK